MDNRNLNPWYAVLWRRCVRQLRRGYYAVNTRARERLWTERRHIAHKEVLTESGRAELGRLNDKLGYGSVYKFTSAQRTRRLQIIDELFKDKKL